MCGIAGSYTYGSTEIPDREFLKRMIRPLNHRGPDGYGFFRAPGAGFAHARLSIIDVAEGWQPLSNEDGSIWICYNGEVYNYIELRRDLVSQGHRFRTNSDTEVLVHLYEEKGITGLLQAINGQYAFALLDLNVDSLFLVRDHVGIHPLNYTINNGNLLFASEIKSILAVSDSTPALDPNSLDQVFTFWGSLSGRTLFSGIQEVPPGCYLEIVRGKATLKSYWEPPLLGTDADDSRSLESYAEELLDLLEDASRIRLRADVPVGCYLSGGLDSSVITYLTQRIKSDQLRTFSVGFEDEGFDEGYYQKMLNNSLGTDNSTVRVGGPDIADSFESVVWHAETPLVRTAPTPLFLLSRSVRENGFKTVLTGEGSDEFLGGYDIFKEALLRNFWERNPESTFRADLFRKLYPYQKAFSSNPMAYLIEYFKRPDPSWDQRFASHWVRWKTTSRTKMFYTDDFRTSLNNIDPVIEFQEQLDETMNGGGTLTRAQYLESVTLLPNYLLSSQGDRMAMANSVEVRFPFLDKRVIELSCKIPSYYKVLGLNEKAVLKRAVRHKLPDEIVRRYKQPYMAPDIPSFITKHNRFHRVAEEHLDEVSVRNAGIFKPSMVENLKQKSLHGKAIGFGDSMSFVGILSTQIWVSQFLNNRQSSADIDEKMIMVDHKINGGSYD